MATPHDPTGSINSLDAVIADYLRAVESGLVPNRQELLDRHADLADALRAFFADLDHMDRIASPLRMAGGLDATGEVDGHVSSGLPTVRYFGDYELLEEIAHGGMGVVYKARQVSLNRIVALKMVLAGTFASPKDVHRFRAEAEAAANLDHPHIVPIYEVGEHVGQQYFSMKFVEGASLAKTARGNSRDEVAKLIDVARAVHYAHQRGILHRDLKPSNVLVDPHGTRFVTDFGLAKRLSDTSMTVTETGQVLGTPRYMAPEQAAGRRDLTVAADVYSLGVILYERLTGQTPFTGDNVLTLLRQVRETEPPRLSSLRPGLDRDLETVVLKCLDKDPSRRYATADALADDLGNWLAGRPISARPVGQAERAWRWCRRNPAVAGLGAAVVASLAIGIVTSTLFALRADARARAERRERLRAEKAETVAVAARDETERTLARSLVGPLDPMGDDGSHETLSAPESTALWELSRHQNDPIAFRFLDEAIRDPSTLTQLRARSEPALIAAVGLDPGRRDRASDLIASRIDDRTVPLRQKADLALIALELEDRPGPITEHCASVMAKALTEGLSTEARQGWARHLSDASSHLEPVAAASCLIAALDRVTDLYHRYLLAKALGSVASRLLPKEAERVCGPPAHALADELGRATVYMDQYWLSEALGPVSAHLSPADAARICDALAQSLADAPVRETSPYNRDGVAKALTTVVARLQPEEAGRVCAAPAQALADALASGRARYGRSGLAEELNSVAAYLAPDEAARLCGPPAQALADTLRRETDPMVQSRDGEALNSLAGRLRPGEAARVCGPPAQALADALELPRNAFCWPRLVVALGSLAARLGPDDAARIANRLTDALERATDDRARETLAEALGPVSRRLGPDEAAGVSERIANALGRAANFSNTYRLEEVLGSVAGLLAQEDAARVAENLADALTRIIHTRAGNALVPESQEIVCVSAMPGRTTSPSP